MKKVLVFLLFLLSTLLAAQTKDNLLNDKNFFIEKSIEYDRWLKASGLGKTLRVETVRVTEEAISLDLGFYTTNFDTVTTQWNVLKRQFDAQDRGMILEEELFNKMLYFMEIKPMQGYVQLFNSYDTKKDLYTCFYRGIRYEDGRFTVKAEGCKTQSQEFTVEPANLSNLRTVAKGQITKLMNKEAVFEKIKNYINSRFSKTDCEYRKPNLEWITTNDELHFIVTDLCKEVLVDETNPWWCSVLEPACTTCKNCRKREMLEIHIKHSSSDNGGYRIHVQIDAKFGSGWYSEVKRGAYKNMELDYKKYVEDYAKRFANDLFNFLKQ